MASAPQLQSIGMTGSPVAACADAAEGLRTPEISGDMDWCDPAGGTLDELNVSVEKAWLALAGVVSTAMSPAGVVLTDWAPARLPPPAVEVAAPIKTLPAWRVGENVAFADHV